MKKHKLDDRLKNPIFIASVISTILLAGGVDLNTLTSWNLLWDAILGILSNPIAMMLATINVYGIFNDNTTKELDGIKIIKKK